MKDFTKKELRELCRRAYKYGEDSLGIKKFFENEGSEIKRDPQIDLSRILAINEECPQFIVQDFDEVIDANIYDDILDDVSVSNKADCVVVVTPKELIEKIKNIPHNDDYWPMEQEPFGGTDIYGRYIINCKKRGMKIYFYYYL